jgi:hypothetical protein
MLKTSRALLLLCCVFITPYGHAGTSCDQKPLTPAVIAAASEKALVVRSYLKQENPKVAILARVGSDISKYGMYYTHAGYVLKSPKTGEWSVIHLLNKCGTATSHIYEQGLTNFFLDDLLNMDVRVIVPTPVVQNKLAAVLSTDRVVSFHNKNYSMIAYPFSTEYQNSNQWILELLGSALSSDAKDRSTAQDYLQASGYVPTLIPINAVSKLGAGIFKSNVSFDDHPDQENSTGKYSVVTVDSIVNYLKQQHMISADKEFRS